MLDLTGFTRRRLVEFRGRQWIASVLVAFSWVYPAAAQQPGFGSQPSLSAPTGPMNLLPPGSGSVIQVPHSEPFPNRNVGAIQQVQNTPQAARAIHRLIEKLPEAQDDLEIIERRSQLVVTRSNVTRMAIGDQSVIDIVQYSPKEFSIIGMGRGATTLTLWFEGEPDPLIYTVRTIRDPSLNKQRELDYGQLERQIAKMYPNSKVYLIPFSWKIVVRGQARDQEEASHILNIIRGEVINQNGGMWGGALMTANGTAGGPGGYGGIGDAGVGAWGGNNFWSSFIINELRVPGEYQINLRVRVAELSRSQLDHAGVDINVLFNDARNAISTTLGGAAGTLSGVFENGEIGIFLDYLSTNGTAKILTEPQMTVLSGRNARLLSGGEFAVPTIVGIAGAQGTTTSFRGFGTSLLATPTVVDRDLIRISIIAEYSNLNQANNSGGILGTDSRRIQTEVELREGQTLALAGLLSYGMKTEVTRIPVLGDIPKIGPLLFSSKTMTQEENELLVLVTPEIVRPMDAHEVPPVPGFEVTKPSHYEFWKYNMTEGSPDVGYYHLPPYGSGSVGTNVDYQHFNPGPAGSMYSPVPTSPMSNARGMTPGAGTPSSIPSNGSMPSSGPALYNGPMPYNGSMPSNGPTTYSGPTPNSGSSPYNSPTPYNGSMPYNGPTPYNGQMPSGGGMPSNSTMMPGGTMSPSGQMPSNMGVPPTPSAQPGRLYPVPQSSTNGLRPSQQRYSNQVMMPGNNTGIRQAGYEQLPTPPASSGNQRRY